MKTQYSSVQRLAIMLQRGKTFAEINGIQGRHWDAYERLSHAIYSLEKSAKLQAPALRDEEDESEALSRAAQSAIWMRMGEEGKP